ncbi:MAG: RNA 2',3'-cyclic phosphodiesterase [Candidatus Pacearchaeota archaeon]
MENNKIRAFISIDLSREAINYIKEIQKLIKKQNLLNGKFTDPENLHLTLKFLGGINEEKIEAVKKKLKEIKIKSFEAELGEAGIFNEHFLKIIWIKLNGKGIFELQKQIDEKLSDLFEKENRFMSHITIARIKNVGNKKGLLGYIENMKTEKITFKVKDFVIKKSELKPEGPVYTDIKRYELE